MSILMSVGWNVKWCPVSRIIATLTRIRPFPCISKKSRLVRASRETSKFHNLSFTQQSPLYDWNIADKA